MRTKNHFLRYLIIFALALTFISYGCYDPPANGCDDDDNTGSYDTTSKGPYATTQNLSAGPNRDSGLFYPSSGSGPFPILVFGCGAGTNPRSYVDHGNYIASWGFIVMIETSTTQGTELTDAIDWLEDQNTVRSSVLYQKCNLSKIAAGGHSRGSLGTFAISGDPRLTTTIHVAGGAGDGAMGSVANGSDLIKPAAFICGAADTMATPNAEIDYRYATVPVFMTVMDGVDHISAAREGLPAICAWMLWQLSGETERKADFLDANGYFQKGMWDSKAKNW